MEPLPSTSAAAADNCSEAASHEDGPPSDDDVEMDNASTSGSHPVQQQEQELSFAYLRASVKQCKQLFAATCLVRLNRCQVPDAPTAEDTEPDIPAAEDSVIDAPEAEDDEPDAHEVEDRDPEANAAGNNAVHAPEAEDSDPKAPPSSSDVLADPRFVFKVEEDSSSSEDVELVPLPREAGSETEESGLSSSSEEEDIKVFASSPRAPSSKRRHTSTFAAKSKGTATGGPSAAQGGPSSSSAISAVKMEDSSDSESTGSESESEDDEVASPATERSGVAKKKSGKGIPQQPEASVPCKVCKKPLCSESYLKIHLRKHSGDMRYKCDKCGRSFWHPSTFIKHKKVRDQRNGVCPRERKEFDGSWRPKGSWTCKICGKRMKSGANYMSHLRSHRGEKPFKCDECGKAFVTKGNLTQHKTFHSGVWQFTCVFCDKGFHQQHALWGHLRVHTEEKPYFCVVERCGASFGQLEGLKHHRRRHHFKKY